MFRARHSRAALWWYCVLVAANLLVTTGLVAGLVQLGVEAHVAKGISIVVAASLNFVALRSWVFRADPVALN